MANKKRRNLPTLNQCCKDLNAFRCGENCVICFGYDDDDILWDYDEWSGAYDSDYEEYDDDDTIMKEDHQNNLTSLNSELTGTIVLPGSLDLANMKEWPRLPTTFCKIISNKLSVLDSIASLDKDEESSWQTISIDDSSLCSGWDLLSGVASIRSKDSWTNKSNDASCCKKNEESSVQCDSAILIQKIPLIHETQEHYCSRWEDEEKYYHDHYDELFDSFRDGVKLSRGGKKKLMFKGNQRQTRRIRCCPSCDWETKKKLKSDHQKEKKYNKRFCSEMTWTG